MTTNGAAKGGPPPDWRDGSMDRDRANESDGSEELDGLNAHDGSDEYDDELFEVHFGSKRLLENRYAHWGLWYGLPTLLVALLSGLIWVSRWDIKVSLQVFGQASVEGHHGAVLRSGRPGALRMGIYKVVGGRYEHPITGTVAFVGAKGQGRSQTLFSDTSHGGVSLDARFMVPQVPAGRYALRFRIHGPSGLRRALVPVDVVAPDARDAVMQPKLRIDEKTLAAWNPASADEDGLVIELVPRAGWRVSNEVVEDLYLRAADLSGRPQKVETRAVVLKGLVGSLGPGRMLWNWRSTGTDGLSRFTIVNRQPVLVLGVEYRQGPGGVVHRRRFSLVGRPAQASLTMASRVVRPGSKQVVACEALLDSAGMYLDGYHNGHLTWMARGALQRGKVEYRVVAPNREGLWFLQAYSDMIDPGNSAGTVVAFVTHRPVDGALAAYICHVAAVRIRRWTQRASKGTKGGRAPVAAVLDWEASRLEGLSHWVRNADDQSARQVIQFALSRLEAFLYVPAMIENTLPKERAALKARQHRAQHYLLGLFVMGLVGLLAAVGWVVVVQVRMRRASLALQARLMEDDVVAHGSPAQDGDGASGGGEGLSRENEDGSDGVVGDALYRTDLGRDKKESPYAFALQIGILVALVLFTVAAVLVLVTNLMWGM